VNGLSKIFPAQDFALIAVVLAMPLIGAFVNGVFGKRLGKEAVRLMALSALGASFVASVITFVMLGKAEAVARAATTETFHPVGKLRWVAWRWLEVNGQAGQSVPIDVAFGVDAMTATMMLVVTGVGFLIHLYSSEYMKKDPGYYRFFAYLNLFIFSMLVLIMGDNLPVLFVGWEGVGLCSYLLIGFWFSEEKNATAGKKAFIANRIGDFGLLCAMAMLLYFCGTLAFDGIKNTAATSLMTEIKVWPLGNLPIEKVWDAEFAQKSMWPNWLVHLFLPEKAITVKAATLVAWSLFLGCAGKSAQIPLYVWLPDAMAGPTPVSALIHAATMVTAGVYLVARMSDVFVLSPAAMATVAVVGAATAIFAASMGLFQNDLKKVLAYSTVSQLGFMFIGVGVGAFASGFFHVFTHAFFKACLFLGAGSVIYAMHARIHDTDASQDMRNMGGLAKHMPITHWTYFVSCLSIAGFPLTAGFFSKDEILWRAYINQAAGPKTEGLWMWPTWLGPSLYWVGIIGATMTSFYMFRSYFLTFHGEFRGWKIVKGWVDPHAGHDHHGHDDHGHHDKETGKKLEGPTPQESPLPMTIPLMVLGAFALVAGFLGAEPLHIAPLVHKLEPIFANAEKLVGLRAGTHEHGGQMWLMMIPGVAACFGGIVGAYHVYITKNGGPEEAFKTTFPGLYNLIYEKWRIDELYDATVIGMVDALADIFVMADTWIVDGIIAKLTALVTAAIGGLLRIVHTGRVQIYAASMVIGLAVTGWFFVQPKAAVTIDDSKLNQTGEVVVTAAPGLGYAYQWSGKDVKEAEFSPKESRYQFTLAQGETREVTVRVRNAFGRETATPVVVTREKPQATIMMGGNRPIQLPVQPQPAAPQGAGDAPPGQIKLDAKDLPNLIRGGGQ
jgi:NADH-quinone oxidoreductase subunit L